MPDSVKFSELQTAADIGGGDLAALAVEDQQAETGYSSKKATIQQIGGFLNNGLLYGALETSNKKPIGAINELQNLIMSQIPEKTASGPIANFTTSLALPLKSCNIEIKPKQASGTPTPSNPLPISGTDTVIITQTGKNRGELSENNKVNVATTASYTFENNGITVSASGTYARVAFGYKVETGKKYTVSFYGYGTGNFKNLYYNNASEWGDSYGRTVLTTTRTKYTKTITANSNILFVGFYDTSSGTTGDMNIEDFMIEEGETATTFEAYTATTKTVSLPETVYGGEVDVIGGSGENTYSDKIDLGSLSWTLSANNHFFATAPNIITTDLPLGEVPPISCEIFKPSSVNDVYGKTSPNIITKGRTSHWGSTQIAVYAPDYANTDDFISAVTGKYVCYKVATPTPITLANPIELNAQAGVNNVFGDTDGNTTVIYKQSIPDAIAEVQALALS